MKDLTACKRVVFAGYRLIDTCDYISSQPQYQEYANDVSYKYCTLQKKTKNNVNSRYYTRRNATIPVRRLCCCAAAAVVATSEILKLGIIFGDTV